jgi:hypothetical protein
MRRISAMNRKTFSSQPDARPVTFGRTQSPYLEVLVMLRAVLGVIVGYIVMALFVIVGISAAFKIMGADGTFEPERYDVTTKYVLVVLGVGFLAGIMGGCTCAWIARLPKLPMAMAAIILVFGILGALPYVMTGDQEVVVRPPEVDSLEVWKLARPPAWVALLLPVIGAAGVLAGARIKSPPKATTPT